jgi:hypothetical protein
MRDACVAEWLLAKLTTRESVVAIVGDLVEQRDERGTLWFWASVAGTSLSLVWRPVCGFVAAYITFLFAFAGMLQSERWQVIRMNRLLYSALDVSRSLSQ